MLLALADDAATSTVTPSARTAESVRFMAANIHPRRDARIGGDQVCSIDDISAHHDIIVRTFSDNCRALALLDDIAGNRVARGTRRIKVYADSQRPRHRLDTGDHVSGDRGSIRAGVEYQDAFADCLQYRTPDNRRIGTAHLKPDDFLRRRLAADRDATGIADVFCRVVRIEMRRIGGHRRAIRNDDIPLHAVLQEAAGTSGSHRMARMRKATARDADILRSGAEHDAVMDVLRRLPVANVMDVAICDTRVAHR